MANTSSLELARSSLTVSCLELMVVVAFVGELRKAVVVAVVVDCGYADELRKAVVVVAVVGGGCCC